MAGALLGLISGGVLGYAGQKHREEIEAEHEGRLFAQQAFMQGLQQNPAIIDNPEVQKQGKKHFGKTWDLMSPVFQATAAEHKRNAAAFATLFGGGAPSPAGGPPAGPTAAPTPTMTRPPATMPATQITGPGTAPLPAQAPQTSAPDPATSSAPIGAPEQHLQALELALASPRFDEGQKKAIGERIKDLREELKKTGQGDKSQKAPPELNAIAHAFTGKGFDQLDQAGQQQALAKYQQFKEDPSLKAFSRTQDAWLRHEDRRESERDKVQQQKDATSQRNYAGKTRSSLTAFAARATAQTRLIQTTSKDPASMAAQADMLNADADNLEQSIEQDKANGLLPADFTYKPLPRYHVDPAKGGFVASVTRRLEGAPPGVIRGESGSTSGDTRGLIDRY